MSKLEMIPVGAGIIQELATSDWEDAYVAQATAVPACLVPILLRLPHNPLAAWRLLCAQATELGLLEACSSLWLLLLTLALPAHREDSCVLLALVDGNAHYVRAWRRTPSSLLLLADLPCILFPLLVTPLGRLLWQQQ
jgi:hypothetical protein